MSRRSLSLSTSFCKTLTYFVRSIRPAFREVFKTVFDRLLEIRCVKISLVFNHAVDSDPTKNVIIRHHEKHSCDDDETEQNDIGDEHHAPFLRR